MILKEILKKEHGNAIVFASFALIGLLAIAGLILDGGTVYMTKSHLQKVANATALSGAQELTTDESAVLQVIDKILVSHNEKESLIDTSLNLGKSLTIHLEKDVPLALSTLFGRDSVAVHASATAEIGTMGRAIGAAPLGIDDSIELEFYREYKLKVDEEDVDTGNFGVLALGDTGAKTYEYNLRHGYDHEVSVGNIIETQTGNIAGKTRTVINERVQSCPYLPGEINHRDCSRVLLVPVYEPYYISTNQLKEIKITGFAYFYISEPMDSNDTSITGKFIKRTGTGFIDPASIDSGAYSVRLTR